MKHLKTVCRSISLPLSLWLLSILFFLPISMYGKKYQFKMAEHYDIVQIRVAEQGYKYVKVWGIGKNADRAIEQAKMNAVAACLFEGVAANEIAGRIPPLCPEGASAYDAHREYFDNFFSSGLFLEYVKSVNSRYPTGADNVSTSKGRRVGIYLEICYDDLRKKLEKDGIIKSLDSYF